MSQQQITVGKSRDVTFIVFDQNGNANPVDPTTGAPLMPLSCEWSLGELMQKSFANPRIATASDPLSAFTLTPSEDTFTCNVAAVELNKTLVLHCHATIDEAGTIVHTAETIESVGEGGETTPVIASLVLQFGPEQ